VAVSPQPGPRGDDEPDTGLSDAGAGRIVELPGDRELEIRSMRGTDAPGLIALYSGLGDDDLYYRFFSGHAPPESFVERMALVGERGGIGLVAVLKTPGEAPVLVGEASCELLPDGNGELGITVAGRARGWLGPFLLDTLAQEAARRGIAGIEADVLVTNGRMLALLRRRGYAVMEHSDSPAIVRVLFATAERVPGWPGPHDRPRLLLEVPGGRWRDHEAAQAAGYQVLACPGPSGQWHGCPALRGEPCPLVQEADLVLDLVSAGQDGSLMEAHRRLHPSVPVCVQLPPGYRDDAAEDPSVAATEAPAVIGLLERFASATARQRCPDEEGN
jgi:hypothetical protein